MKLRCNSHMFTPTDTNTVTTSTLISLQNIRARDLASRNRNRSRKRNKRSKRERPNLLRGFLSTQKSNLRIAKKLLKATQRDITLNMSLQSQSFDPLTSLNMKSMINILSIWCHSGILLKHLSWSMNIPLHM